MFVNGITDSITTETVIEWVISKYPSTVPVFLRWRMQCVGCPIAPFESVADACAIYHHPTDLFLSELQIAASQGDQPRFQ